MFDPDFLGIHRSAGCIVIQVTLVTGRSLEQKGGFLPAGDGCAAGEARCPSGGRRDQPRTGFRRGLVVRQRRGVTRQRTFLSKLDRSEIHAATCDTPSIPGRGVAGDWRHSPAPHI
ncbi:tautomerase family protein [Methylobacterium sp. J-072]|nr:tautomerase family protein [Methylobacterium sp. J-072]MCJ2095144.1 tautomerase family protein [Methylobacterium sp. J-072]